MLGEDLSFREKVVAMSTMLSLIDLNVITPPPSIQSSLMVCIDFKECQNFEK